MPSHVKMPHMAHRWASASTPLGGNYVLFRAQVRTRDERTDERRSAQTGTQTDTRLHAGSHNCEAPQVWHRLDPSGGHLKGLNAIPSFFRSCPPSLLLSSLWTPSRQPITLMALFSALSTPPSPLPLHHFLPRRRLRPEVQGRQSPRDVLGFGQAPASQTATGLTLTLNQQKKKYMRGIFRSFLSK